MFVLYPWPTEGYTIIEGVRRLVSRSVFLISCCFMFLIGILALILWTSVWVWPEYIGVCLCVWYARYSQRVNNFASFTFLHIICLCPQLNHRNKKNEQQRKHQQHVIMQMKDVRKAQCFCVDVVNGIIFADKEELEI